MAFAEKGNVVTEWNKKKKAGSSQNSFEPRCAVFEGVKLCFEGSFARLTFFCMLLYIFLYWFNTLSPGLLSLNLNLPEIQTAKMNCRLIVVLAGVRFVKGFACQWIGALLWSDVVNKAEPVGFCGPYYKTFIFLSDDLTSQTVSLKCNVFEWFTRTWFWCSCWRSQVVCVIWALGYTTQSYLAPVNNCTAGIGS